LNRVRNEGDPTAIGLFIFRARIAMTHPAHPQVNQWRPLSDAEFATSSEAKLGGALAVIFCGAVAMVALVVLAICWLIASGDFLNVTMMSMVSGGGTASVVGAFSMIPEVMFLVWAFVFAIMTMGRRPSTPMVAGALMMIWAMMSIGTQIIVRYVIANNSLEFGSQATLLPYVLIEIVLVAAFCGYMSEGRRPNIYFRRRVRA
jgi:hypothetical protein